MKTNNAKQLKLIRSITYDAKTQRFHAWIDTVISSLLPFNFVKSETIRKYFTHASISRTALMKYMHDLLLLVEKKIREVLPNRLAITFDGWGSGDTHYNAVFATFPSQNDFGYDIFLLACSPMENEESLNADEHFEFLSFVLSVFGKSMDNVVAVTGDNCNTNKFMVRRTGPTFVGCHSYRINLFVQDFMQPYADIILKVSQLMRKLSYQIPSAKLRAFTTLNAKMSNATRWSSTYKMLHRLEELLPFLIQIEYDEIKELLPSDDEQTEIKSLLKN